jgi:hypothetical protein
MTTISSRGGCDGSDAGKDNLDPLFKAPLWCMRRRANATILMHTRRHAMSCECVHTISARRRPHACCEAAPERQRPGPNKRERKRERENIKACRIRRPESDYGARVGQVAETVERAAEVQRPLHQPTPASAGAGLCTSAARSTVSATCPSLSFLARSRRPDVSEPIASRGVPTPSQSIYILFVLVSPLDPFTVPIASPFVAAVAAAAGRWPMADPSRRRS